MNWRSVHFEDLLLTNRDLCNLDVKLLDENYVIDRSFPDDLYRLKATIAESKTRGKLAKIVQKGAAAVNLIVSLLIFLIKYSNTQIFKFSISNCAQK